MDDLRFQWIEQACGLTGRDTDLTPEEQLEKVRVTPTTALKPMETLFLMYGVPCFYRGELVAVCGKAKSGKTMLLSVLMACALTTPRQPPDDTDATASGTILALERTRAHPTPEKPPNTPLRVLWLDTEQSQQSTQDIIVNRILPLVRAHTVTTEWSDAPPPDMDIDQTFFAYNLRGMGFERRGLLMEVAVDNVQPDLMIIDGIKDLMTDINDAVQATLLMEQLMATAQRHNCCIVCVLHQNKSEADQNMRGSIGTELTNKAFEVYTCEYLEEQALFKVAQRLSRRERIGRELFYRLDDATRLPVECGDVQLQPRDAKGRFMTNKPAARDLRKLFTDAMQGRRQRAYNELMAVALKYCGIADAKTYYEYVQEAVQQGIIRKMVHPETGRPWVELIGNPVLF